MIGFFQSLSFAAPALLWAFLLLPLIWLILRALPPAALRVRFPAVVLLLGLKDEDTTAMRMPWWLLLLRMLVLSLLILAFAGPFLSAENTRAEYGARHLILVDSSWPLAQDWATVEANIRAEASRHQLAGRPLAVVDLSKAPPAALTFTLDERTELALDGLAPRSWRPDFAAWAEVFDDLVPHSTTWFSDGLADPARASLIESLRGNGALEVIENDQDIVVIRDVTLKEDGFIIALARLGEDASDLTISAIGPDPSGQSRRLGQITTQFGEGEQTTQVKLSMPLELRNRVDRFQIEGVDTVGAAFFSETSLKRRKVALYSIAGDDDANDLLSPLHFLREALFGTAEVIEGSFLSLIDASPDILILTDQAGFGAAEASALNAWIEGGGLLVRFAGPRLATFDASNDLSQQSDPFLPVRLRTGGRTIGGAMTWGSPRALRDFADNSPFFGLPVTGEVKVTSQVLAEPTPDLAAKTLASLEDRTPLVTADARGLGRIVLFHVTANTEWSDLPISGLFLQMLSRLGSSVVSPSERVENLSGRRFTPEKIADGFGNLQTPEGLRAVAGETLLDAPEREKPVGLYINGNETVAVNALTGTETVTQQIWPADVRVTRQIDDKRVEFQPRLLSIAFILMMLDALLSLRLLGGGTRRARANRTQLVSFVIGALFAAVLPADPSFAQAQIDPVLVTNDTTLGYVLTGDARQDRISKAGLQGLANVLNARTSIEPIEPIGVDLEVDALALFPFLYWPITEVQGALSADAVANVNDFLRSGGMILFDTRSGGFGGDSSNLRLRKLTQGLAIPPLEILPQDHVLTRTFYLLQDFPGRYFSNDIWVEAAPDGADQTQGVPFRNLNDGVTPVIIGANDWAAAWAVDENGQYLRPVGRGSSGRLQREYAYRFGINLLMYVMTGNYKSDQVHVPALLDRLGN